LVAAFAMIHPKQFFRGAGTDVRDVFDADADLAVLNVANRSTSTSSGIADRGKLETFPSWSPDGTTLYFSCAAPPWDKDNPTTVQAIKLKYDLMCVPYDLEQDVWGAPETMLSSLETGMSISEPRASPDGRYLLFCMADYGTFPVHRPSSDLHLMDLKTRQHRRLECNSPESESWHCWSSNSRWIVFSSKRDNGLLARPYFCYMDSKGREHKPFVLPQKDPAFYDQWLNTYNVPELVSGPITISEQDLAKAVRSSSDPTGQPER
jgi:Tol biopolymer transport system component